MIVLIVVAGLVVGSLLGEPRDRSRQRTGLEVFVDGARDHLEVGDEKGEELPSTSGGRGEDERV